MDHLDSHERSMLMAKIKSTNTTPEIKLRKFLFKNGLRYRINVRTIPGTPDIVLPKYRAVIFVHGCYWHQHGCSVYKDPKTNAMFWQNKFRKNKERDFTVSQDLAHTGWRIAVVWECALSKALYLKTGKIVLRWILSSRKRIEVPE
jgi:DNA mismatch endonuclease (patch repair protein)